MSDFTQEEMDIIHDLASHMLETKIMLRTSSQTEALRSIIEKTQAPIHPERIDSFSGEYDFLSNFYYATIHDDDGLAYITNEHYYQAQKTLQPTERTLVRVAGTPGRAKRVGREVTLRLYWDTIKINVMRRALTLKFTQHDDLREKLLATGDAWLVEKNNWGDDFWGIVTDEEGVSQGLNWLGILLTVLREQLRFMADA